MSQTKPIKCHCLWISWLTKTTCSSRLGCMLIAARGWRSRIGSNPGLPSQKGNTKGAKFVPFFLKVLSKFWSAVSCEFCIFKSAMSSSQSSLSGNSVSQDTRPRAATPKGEDLKQLTVTFRNVAVEVDGLGEDYAANCANVVTNLFSFGKDDKSRRVRRFLS